MRSSWSRGAAVGALLSLLALSCATRKAPLEGERLGAVASAISTCVRSVQPVGARASESAGAFMVLKTDGSAWLNPLTADGTFAALPVVRIEGLAGGVDALADSGGG